MFCSCSHQQKSTFHKTGFSVVFFSCRFLICFYEFSLHEETIHHRAAAALVLGRLEEAVGLYLANELLAEALKSWGRGWTGNYVDKLIRYSCMMIESYLISLQSVGTKVETLNIFLLTSHKLKPFEVACHSYINEINQHFCCCTSFVSRS